jgi:chaperonin GroEL
LPKLVLYGVEARKAMVRGVDFLVNAAKVTLGPKGRLVVMSRRNVGMTPLATKDGATCARHCDPKDPFEQIGSDLVREASEMTVRNAGDGTTSSLILAQALIHAGIEQLDSGKSPAELERGINKAVSAICEQLDKMALPADGERLAQVATISANGDEEIGRMVHAAIKKVGKDGVMTCEESRSFDTVLDVVDGMQIKKGYCSPYFMTDPERQEAILENCQILMFEGKLGAAKSLVSVINLAMKQGQPLLIIAGDFEPEALNLLVANRIRRENPLPLCAIRADAWGPRRAEILRDIAVLTGGKAITEDTGIKLENVTLDFFGKAKKVVVSEFRTTIIEGTGDAKAIETRANEIRKQIEKCEADDVRVLVQGRLAGLTGGIAVIRVGGVTEQEAKEKKDRVEDALFATKAAAEEGIVPGGGLALMAAAASTRQDEFMIHACCAPAYQIAQNAGLDWAVKKLAPHQIFVFGLNAVTGEFQDLTEAGIIDPVKVVKEALKNAASVAITILKTESLICDLPEAK